MTASMGGAALMATAAGILVAVPVTCLYYLLRAYVEQFEIGISAEAAVQNHRTKAKFELLPRFSSLPPFALLAAPCLATFIIVAMMFSTFHRQQGLYVHLLKPGPCIKRFTVEPIVVGVQHTSGKNTAVYIDSKETQWGELEKTLLRDARLRPRSPVYVQAGNNVSWQEVVNVIDELEGLHAHVVLFTAAYLQPLCRSYSARPIPHIRKERECVGHPPPKD